MTIETTDLTVDSKALPGKDMPDGSAKAHAGGSNGSLAGYNETWGMNPWRSGDPEPGEKTPDASAMSASDLNQGFKALDVERTAPFDPDLTGEEQIGDPYSAGGVCGRPRGQAR